MTSRRTDAGFAILTNRSVRSDQTYCDVEAEGIGGGRDARTERAEAEGKLEGCRNIVPGILQLDVGIATPGLEATCDVVLVSDFADQAALDAYQVHPVHQEVKKFVVNVVEGRQCLDYLVDGTR